MIAFEAIVVLLIAIGALPVAASWKTLIWTATMLAVVYFLRRGSQEITISQPRKT